MNICSIVSTFGMLAFLLAGSAMAGKEAQLQPGGYHVMLIGLKEQLMPGQQVELTLVFKDGSRAKVAAPVQKLQMKMMKDMGGMKMQHD